MNSLNLEIKETRIEVVRTLVSDYRSFELSPIIPSQSGVKRPITVDFLR